jgi:hypothetical protein
MTDESLLGPVATARIRENEAGFERQAERDDALGAEARCLLAWYPGEHPSKDDMEASRWLIDVGGEGFGLWTPTYTEPPPGEDSVGAAVADVLVAAGWED